VVIKEIPIPIDLQITIKKYKKYVKAGNMAPLKTQNASKM
jgi:hypothetical protein